MSKADSSAIKGLAILMIMGAHICQAYSVGLMNPLAPVGVFLFLFCSGYGLQRSYAKTGLQLYFRKKLIKVYLPYIASVLLYIVLSVVVLQNNSFNIIRLFTLMDMPQGSYWYLRLQFYWYFIFWLLKKVRLKPFTENILLLSFSGIVICLSGFNASYMWQLFSFPLGVIAATYDWNFNIKKVRVGAVIVLFAVALLIKKSPSVESNELGFADITCQLVMTVALSTLILIFIHMLSKRGLILYPFRKMGRCSYVLYLSHIIALDYLRNTQDVLTYIIWTVGFFMVLSLVDKFATNLLKVIIERHDRKHD